MRNLFHCTEPRSFEVANVVFQSQEICPYEFQDSERYFLISLRGEQGAFGPLKDKEGHEPSILIFLETVCSEQWALPLISSMASDPSTIKWK